MLTGDLLIMGPKDGSGSIIMRRAPKRISNSDQAYALAGLEVRKRCLALFLARHDEVDTGSGHFLFVLANDTYGWVASWDADFEELSA